MRYVICFGEYYYRSADIQSETYASLNMTKNLQQAAELDGAEALRIQGKYGGVLKSFWVELEEV